MSYRGQIADLIRETSSNKTMQINFTVIVFNEKEYNRLVLNVSIEWKNTAL